jgi:predicted nicotinamide N-methyase
VSEPLEFVRANTVVASPPLVPEIRLHLASEVTPLWQATEATLAEKGLPPPYWAFAWPGGQALARHILDHTDLVRGRRVLDVGAGSGLCAIAAALAGAAAAANDIDGFARAAIALNAGLNGVAVETVGETLIGSPRRDWAAVLAGDMCYERPLAAAMMAWLRALARDGALVLLGEPGRNYRPREGIVELARYEVPTSRDLEDREMREAVVWRVSG